MTDFRIEPMPFTPASVEAWAETDERHRNWPVVYTLTDTGEVYIGETINAAARLRQHLDSKSKRHLHHARVIIDDRFNKSACLDLESYLIRLFSGDGHFQVLNRNDGITNADYYDRNAYQQIFIEIFDELRELGLFTRSIVAIENTDLFKLSPFKALNQDQAIAVEDILQGLFEDLEHSVPSQIVIQGDPGTGKTVIAIYLMKLLRDIQLSDGSEAADEDSILGEFFAPGYPELLSDLKVALVVPQQSLRKSIQEVFRRTPALDSTMVLSPFQVGESESRFDLLIVDETHRLTRRANQSSGTKNTQFKAINHRLFGDDDPSYTQIDWINAMSEHQIYLVDSTQRVRPMDVSEETLRELERSCRTTHRWYPLTSQMRVQAGEDYVGYVRDVLSQRRTTPATFTKYDLRFFDDIRSLVDEIHRRDQASGLSRLLAGYAWKWRSKREKTAYDIEIDDVALQWNQTDVDWINSPGSVNEVGSIHTIQGYDLNYAGVIIGRDLRLDPASGRIVFDRTNYFDRKGKENLKDHKFSDDELLAFVRNIYSVLLTRGMLGTYVYVCDGPLRDYLRPFFN